MMTGFLASVGLPASVALAVAWATLAWGLSSGVAKRIMDHPTDRSLHQAPVPRVGGLCILLGATGGFLLLPHWSLHLLALATLAVFAVSLADDMRGVSAVLRLAVHLGAAAVVVFRYGQEAGPLWFWMAVIGLAWMTNLFNFMDGSDGLAGGMAVFGLGFLGYAAWMAGRADLAGIAFVLAGAALAFLGFNFPPAKVFLGDAGSAPLGFLSGGLAFVGMREGAWPVWYPLLVFSPFIADATATLVLRLWRGGNILQAHREHYYQRLVQLGWGHRRTALVYYAVMLGAGLSGSWGLGQPFAVQFVLCAVWSVAYLVAMLTVNRMWFSHASRAGR